MSKSITVGDLLNCFFDESRTQFQFLVQKHGYRQVLGMSYERKGRQVIVPYNGKTVSMPFRAISRYEQGNITLELVYNGEYYILEPLYYYQHYKLSWPELFAQLLTEEQVKDMPTRTHQFVHPETLTSAIRKSATLLKNTVCLYQPNKRNEKCLETAINQALQDRYENEMKLYCEHATQAFLDRDYKRVIALMRPFERDLSLSDKKMLELAIKRIIDPIAGD